MTILTTGLRAFALCFLAVGAALAQATQIAHFDIPAQPLASALETYAKQARVEFLIPYDAVEGVTSTAVQGELDKKHALELLLKDTDLEARFADDGAVQVIRRVSTAASTYNGVRVAQAEATGGGAQQVAQTASTNDGNEEERMRLDEIVVTGSRIRGAQSSAPVLSISQDEMRLSGHVNLGEVIRSLPQNFGGGQNPEVFGITAAAGGNANQNLTGSSSLNLRGLGPDATLTLLNGTRLPYDGLYQATDVSVIPVAAIDRMEILLDGASAIYGSDAVGGVANIILKHDYQGAEISARYRAATEGGDTQTQYTGVGGLNWGSGGALGTFDLAEQSPVRARNRDFLAYIPNQAVTISPEIGQKSGLVSGHQNLGDRLELALDAFYTERTMDDLGQSSVRFTNHGRTETWGLSPAVRFHLPGKWSLRVHGFSGRNEADRHSRNFLIGTDVVLFQSRTAYLNKTEAIGIESEGPAFELPGGAARISLGIGYRKNSFDQADLLAGIDTVSAATRSRYGFGEMYLPLVSPEQRIRGMTQLSLNGAIRHENYGADAFGQVTTPKVGLLWGVTADLDLKASWGKSFKAPTLEQQYSSVAAILYPGVFFPGIPFGSTVLSPAGGNPDLDPERAEVLTAGFALRPQWLPGSSFELGYFHVDYTDRVFTLGGLLFQAPTDPALAEFVTPSPSQAEQQAILDVANPFISIAGPYNPATVAAIVDGRYFNATQQKVEGLDVSARYATELFAGRMSFSGNASWLEGQRHVTSLAPERDIAGVIFFPAKFRGRVGASWSRGGMTVASYVNHTGAVKNTRLIPNPEGASMTTLDATFDYLWDSDAIGEVRLNLAVTNLFDKRPPFLQPLQPYETNYDSTNYTALGRLIGATISKRW